jgi:phosphonate transport system permease protein
VEQSTEKEFGIIMKNNQNKHKAFKLNFRTFSALLTLGLIISSWSFIIIGEDANIFDLFTEKNAFYAKKFFGSLIGIGQTEVAFTNIASWKSAIELTIETLQMSVMAIGFATIVMFLTVIPASRNVADGSLTLSKKWYRWMLFGFIRLCYIFSRAIPELLWAMIIIFILKPGILPGAIALAVHNFGILGKLCAEVIEDFDAKPVRNLSSSGANKTQIFFYGVIPTIMPHFLSYILYRWEVIMRTTIVVGFVGAGGLGQQFKLSMSYFDYTYITLLLICYLVLVVLADFFSEGSRKAIK